LRWIESLLSIHGRYFKDNSGTLATELRAIQRAVDDIRENLRKLTEKNMYDLDYLLSKPVLADKMNGAPKAIQDYDAIIMEGEDERMSDADGDDREGEWVGLE
jgi:periodic tryptophan protein 2